MKPVEILKKITSMMNSMENMNLKKDMNELYTSLEEIFDKNMELREIVTELKEEIAILKEKNSMLEKELERKESVELNDGAYWTKDGDGPYCQVCHDLHNRNTKVTKVNNKNHMECPVCGHEYETAAQKLENKEKQRRFLNTISDLNKY